MLAIPLLLGRIFKPASMKSGSVLASSVILAVIFPGLVHLTVPPKTPVLSGFEPAAIGSYRELVCDALQPGAGNSTYKWYKYSTAHGVEDWESKGPIGLSQKYVFDPVTENKVFYSKDANNQQPVSGKYKCNATNNAGTKYSEWGDLYVYKPCSLYTVSVSPAKPPIGSTFTLNCNIPNPSGMAVNWYKKADASSAAWDVAVANNKGCHAPADPRYSWSSCSPPSISSKTHTFNLQVTNALTADFAYWMCKDIDLSCDSNPVKPIVQALPGTPQITGFPTGSVFAGTQLNFKCDASPPGDAYDWYKDGTNVTTSLTYDFQVTKYSAGVYKCTARNAVGSGTSSNNSLVVYYKADSIIVSSGKTSHDGENDKFTCTVSGGYPTPTVKIYFKRSGGIPVEVSQGQDRVMAKEDNQAEYYCEAKVPGYPALDMTSSRKTYNVTFNPSKITMTQKPSTAIYEGQLFHIVCDTDSAYPVANITFLRRRTGGTWEKLTSGIKSEVRAGEFRGSIRKSTLTVTANRSDNQAVFKCEVKDGSFLVEQNCTVNVYYKAKWNPELTEVFTSASKLNTPMKFVLHVIANPSPTRVTWFFPNMTTVDGAFVAAKVNDTIYTLSKMSVGVNDYGNYTVNVTNDVGISVFVFELEKTGPPETPCCLALVNETAVSLTLTFTSNFAGGSPQTFTIEKRISGGNVWDIAVNGIADPGFGKNVLQKISGLDNDTNYEFRVMATNDDGDGDYGEITAAKTEDITAAPNVSLTVERKDNQVTATWPKLFKEYTKIQIKFCPAERGSCDYHNVVDPTSLKSSFTVKESHTYTYTMIIFDGEDQVFVSAAVVAPTPGPPAGAIGGGVGGVLSLLVIIIAVVLATLFILKKRRAEKERDSRPSGDDTAGLAATPRTSSHIPDPVYVNIDNRTFESDADCLNKKEPVYVNCSQNQHKGDDTGLAEESEYDELHQGCEGPKNGEAHQSRPGDQQERVQEVVSDDFKWTPSAAVAAVTKKKLEDISVEDFKQWLLSKQVTESTYQILAKNGLNKAAIFVLLQREKDLEALRIKPLGQEILVRNLVASFRAGAEAWRGDGQRSHLGEVMEGAGVEVENPYEELNVTPDVIADQVYTKLKPRQFSRADC